MATNAPVGNNPLNAALDGATGALTQIEATIVAVEKGGVTTVVGLEDAALHTVLAALNGAKAVLKSGVGAAGKIVPS